MKLLTDSNWGGFPEAQIRFYPFEISDVPLLHVILEVAIDVLMEVAEVFENLPSSEIFCYLPTHILRIADLCAFF